MVSTITATQKFSAIHPIIRVSATEMYVYKLRNMKDLDTLIDEVSAVLDKKTLSELYHQATAEPSSFLYVKLPAKDRNEMFHQFFQAFHVTARRMILCIGKVLHNLQTFCKNRKQKTKKTSI